jgi:hypothetical protein
MHNPLRHCFGGQTADRSTARRVTSVISVVALLTLTGLFVALMSPRTAAADLLKPTITKDVDANGDNVFNDSENVAKNVTYPLTVTYRLTVTAGSFSHTIVSITDSTTNDIGNCQSLVGTTIAAGSTTSCTYTEVISKAGSAPFVNVATLTYDNAGNDVLSNDSTVNFPGMSLDKSSTTTLITSAGQIVPYSYLISNTGTSLLTGITLVDNKTDAPPSCPSTTLAVGASMTCTGQHTVTLAELTAGGNLVNIATASSNEAPDATDTVSIPIVPPPPPANSGAKTMGFWQNRNGQGIITGQAASGVCPSATWLRQYAPFQDLSASANCAAVATYVYNLIKGSTSNCGGATCNAMLKAQMLATALDVYFSNRHPDVFELRERVVGLRRRLEHDRVTDARVRSESVERRRLNVVWQRQGDAGPRQGRLRRDQQRGRDPDLTGRRLTRQHTGPQPWGPDYFSNRPFGPWKSGRCWC